MGDGSSKWLSNVITSTIYNRESPDYCTLRLTDDKTKAKGASHFSQTTELVSSRAVINGHVGGRNRVLTSHFKDKDFLKMYKTLYSNL